MEMIVIFAGKVPQTFLDRKPQIHKMVTDAAHLVYGPQNQDRYEKAGLLVQMPADSAESISQSIKRLGQKVQLSKSGLVITAKHTWQLDLDHQEDVRLCNDQLMAYLTQAIFFNHDLLDGRDTIYIKKDGLEEGGFVDGKKLNVKLCNKLLEVVKTEGADPAKTWKAVQMRKMALYFALRMHAISSH